MTDELPGDEIFVAAAASRASRRIRNRAVWSLALFCAIVPVALLTEPKGPSLADPAAVGLLGSLFWLCAAGMALLAAWHTFRNWERVPASIRAVGLAPSLCAALVGLLLMLANAIPT